MAEGAGTQAGLPFVLARAAAVPLPKSVDKPMDQQFGGLFKHEAFEKSGFNVLTLPFHYQERDKGGEAGEAQAFAFLLSSDIDWAPDSYCSRHPFSTFERSGETTKGMVSTYDNRAIAGLIRAWGATHGVGGTVIHEQGGMYSGSVLLFDRKGEVIWKKVYGEPRSYWDLLGHASVDVMGALGYKANGALTEYLCKARCGKMASVRALGRAAFLDQQSDAAFGIYEGILKEDPAFAEVRAWYANQKQWRTRDFAGMLREQGTAIESRVLPSVLATFEAGACPDAALAAKLPEWLAQARKLGAEDAPYVLTPQLAELRTTKKFPADATVLVARATQAAGRFPNSVLLSELSKDYADPKLGGADMDMAASVAWAYWRNGYQPGMGKEASGDLLATPLMDLGDYDLALVFLARSVGTEPGNVIPVIYCLEQMGQFAEACKCYDAFAHRPEVQKQLVPYMVVPAAMAGRGDILRGILKDHADALNGGGREVVEWFLARLDGKEAAVPAFRGPPGPFVIARNVVLFEADVQGVGQAFRKEAFEQSRSTPTHRLGWIMKDAYERKEASPDGNDFYLALEFLHPEDPWVKDAVAAWRGRVAKLGAGAGKPTDAAYSVRNLENFSAGRAVDVDRATVWTVVTAVMQFVEQKKFGEARKLVEVHMRLSRSHGSMDCVALDQHLLHWIEGVEHAAGAATRAAKEGA